MKGKKTKERIETRRRAFDQMVGKMIDKSKAAGYKRPGSGKHW